MLGIFVRGFPWKDEKHWLRVGDCLKDTYHSFGPEKVPISAFFLTGILLIVTPDSVLSSQYSSRATVPYASFGKGLEIERKTQKTMVIRKKIS